MFILLFVKRGMFALFCSLSQLIGVLRTAVNFSM